MGKERISNFIWMDFFREHFMQEKDYLFNLTVKNKQFYNLLFF